MSEQLTFSDDHHVHPRQQTTGNRALDQYFTQAWAAERLVDLYFNNLTADDLVIDAGCGRGPFLRAIPPHVPAFGVEIDPQLAAEAKDNTGRSVIVGDFRTVSLPDNVTAILGNPPFSRPVISSFLARGAELLPDNGRCGFILPTSYVSFSSTFDRLRNHFSIRTELLPRDIFPRISVPISFYLFTKSHVRRHFGFVLFNEASEIRDMPKSIKLALRQGERLRSPWLTAVTEALRMLGGRAKLEQIYSVMQGRCPRPIETWKDTIRRVLQEGAFCNVTRGEWALPS